MNSKEDIINELLKVRESSTDLIQQANSLEQHIADLKNTYNILKDSNATNKNDFSNCIVSSQFQLLLDKLQEVEYDKILLKRQNLILEKKKKNDDKIFYTNYIRINESLYEKLEKLQESVSKLKVEKREKIVELSEKLSLITDNQEIPNKIRVILDKCENISINITKSRAEIKAQRTRLDKLNSKLMEMMPIYSINR